jgi:2-keto-myo-inositol isomerase
VLFRSGGKRIAAAPAGVDAPVDFLKAGKYYKQTIDLGRETGVMPQLEFWGAHKYFNHFGQILAVAAAANDSDVHLLPDVYHLFRGDSGFDCLKIVSGNAIEIFHMNDYKLEKPRLEQKDSDRVYPGDGDAPMKEILASLSQMGGTKVLSVELFNPEYWKLDAVTVAKTALEKMNNLVKSI